MAWPPFHRESRRLIEVAEAVEEYGLKVDARRRFLVSEEESRAYRGALVLVAGEKRLYRRSPTVKHRARTRLGGWRLASPEWSMLLASFLPATRYESTNVVNGPPTVHPG
jgi:hypothetical protein